LATKRDDGPKRPPAQPAQTSQPDIRVAYTPAGRQTLEAITGDSDVRVRFVLGSDGISEKLGWYIDLVRVEAYE
jgi:hypothetical protein